MGRRATGSGIGAALLCLALPGAIGVVAAQSRTVWDGVYTAAQSERGRAQYRIYCSACHGATLRGGLDGVEQAPALRRDGFMRGRGDLGNMFDFLKKSMPRDEPGTLRTTDYADILAYLLSENGFPAGAVPLPADRMLLADIRIVGRPAEPVK
jgi:S-disulfanyl-L-cysteine oxidoreductase SoxD